MKLPKFALFNYLLWCLSFVFVFNQPIAFAKEIIPSLNIASTVSQELRLSIQQTWLNLTTLYTTAVNCDSTPTRLTEQGLRGLYCHLETSLSYSELQKRLDFPIFLHGPHGATALNVISPYSFGYYNKQFPNWLAHHAILGANNPQLQARLAPVYKSYLQQQARTYYLAYQFKLNNQVLFKEIKADYLQQIQQQSLPPMYLQEKFRAFADTLDAQGYSWYEANTAAGFWLRREIDTTDKLFFAALQKLLTTYDADFLPTLQN